MPMIAPHVREQIRAASDIVEIIQSYLPLRRAGGNFVALCPFHNEKTPSFHVSPARQMYHCFGCHKSGDVFRFVQDYENVSFPEALRRLAQRAGITIEFDETPAQRDDRAAKDLLRSIHEEITRRWQQALSHDASGQIARDYLAKRGVAPEAVARFRLGYAPDTWDDTVNWARSKGWNPSVVEQAGLIVARDANDRGRGYYDRFRGRLMFPICDEQGRVVAFSGRILAGDEKVAKYLNSPETPIFTKSRTLYGLDKARRAILDTGTVLVCEGQLDLIASHMAGVENMVAPQGTALTAEHLRILRRYAKEAVLCFDSDNAGQKATARILDELVGGGISLRVVTLPTPHDPDSFIKEHGGEAFRQLVAGARDFFDFYLDFLCRRNDARSDRGQLAVLEAMALALVKTDNEALLDRYAQKTSMALASAGGVAPSPDAVRAEFRKRLSRSPVGGFRNPVGDSARKVGTNPAAVAASKRFAAGPPSPNEMWLLKLTFLSDEFAGWLALHLDLQWLRHPLVRELLSRRLELHRSSEWHSPAAFLGELEDEALRSLAAEAMSDTRTIPNPEQQLADLVTRLRNAWIDDRIARTSARSAQPDLSEPERNALLEELVQLRRSKREPLLARM
ncbi:MAG: DNA primase [Limisphaerales bacterium]